MTAVLCGVATYVDSVRDVRLRRHESVNETKRRHELEHIERLLEKLSALKEKSDRRRREKIWNLSESEETFERTQNGKTAQKTIP